MKPVPQGWLPLCCGAALLTSSGQGAQCPTNPVLPTSIFLLLPLPPPWQNDFLRPFVVVMRHSRAVEIRELIIRCVSQMVLARVANVKSGWKSMFMVRRVGGRGVR